MGGAELAPFGSSLLAALGRLDRLLAAAEVQARSLYGGGAAMDPFRGLQISAEEIAALLARPPGVPHLWTEMRSDVTEDEERLERLRIRFDLSPFDIDVLILALAPELDLRYERIFAFLQDDVTRRRPSVDLALNLFCASPSDKIVRRAHFAADAPLVRHGLIHLDVESGHQAPPLLAHILRPDAQITDHLLGQDVLDRRLWSVAELFPPSVPSPSEQAVSAPAEPFPAGLEALIDRAATGAEPLRLLLESPHASERLRVARRLAGLAGRHLVALDFGRVITATPADGGLAAVSLAIRQAELARWVLLIDAIDVRTDTTTAEGHLASLLALLPRTTGAIILGTTRPFSIAPGPALGFLRLRLPPPDPAARKAIWRASLGGRAYDEAALDALASRFVLTAAQIVEAAAIAATQERCAAAAAAGAASATGKTKTAARAAPRTDAAATTRALFAAARAQCGHDLGALAVKIEPRHRFGDIILADDALEQLKEICQRVAFRDRVMCDWGFREKLSTGRGVSVLFSGPSGTGKTMAAEIVASELGIDLFKIDVATVVSKYIGETEKNLERVFAAAQSANAVVLFDEADALFGKRSDGGDALDRYSNLEVGFLLQKMDSFEGTVILATNLRQNIDEAFLRRFAFVVHFPFPDVQSRRRIWERVWPAAVPFAAPLPLDRLSEKFPLSGGNIRNIAVAASFLAVQSGGPIALSHVLHATRREYQKIGRRLSDEDLASI